MEASGPGGEHAYKGRTFVVTGGTGVLGSAVVRALNQTGANIALLTHRSDPPADLAARIGVSATSAR